VYAALYGPPEATTSELQLFFNVHVVSKGYLSVFKNISNVASPLQTKDVGDGVGLKLQSPRQIVTSADPEFLLISSTDTTMSCPVESKLGIV